MTHTNTQKEAIVEIQTAEMELVGGGVTQSPDGSGCTDHWLPKVPSLRDFLSF